MRRGTLGGSVHGKGIDEVTVASLRLGPEVEDPDYLKETSIQFSLDIEALMGPTDMMDNKMKPAAAASDAP